MNAEVRVGNCLYSVRYTKEGTRFTIDIAGREYLVDAAAPATNLFSLLVNNKSYDIIADGGRDNFSIAIDGEIFQVDFLDPRSRKPADGMARSRQEGKQLILAPMAGQIIKVKVKKGDLVKDGEGVVVLEAMKMENELKSQGVGEVQEVLVGNGDVVEPGQKLLIIE